MKPEFNIGDSVWISTFSEHTTVIETCPDCGGTRTLKVVLFNGEEHIIPCEGCTVGYEPPSGVIKVLRPVAKAENQVITGIEIEKDRVKYRFGCYSYYDVDVFDNEDDAKVQALKKALEYQEGARARAMYKIKNHKSWAWHVHYYRREIRDAEKKIERAKERLNYAQEKSHD